jgi:transcriptional regulator of acetoin/glycerol metabolism
MGQLMRYDWPGNVRELENAIEHAFVICGASVIGRADLPPHILGDRPAVQPGRAGTDPDRLSPLQSSEAVVIREALARNGGNRTATARDLGISRNTLWRKMKSYGIE